MPRPIRQPASGFGTARGASWPVWRSRPLALFGLVSIACARTAPGPDECVAFAKSWLAARPAASPLVTETAYEELVRRCLTEPYDRELVTCVVEARNHERCRVDYARRVEARREARSR
jgi:hypothetical protein